MEKAVRVLRILYSTGAVLDRLDLVPLLFPGAGNDDGNFWNQEGNHERARLFLLLFLFAG